MSQAKPRVVVTRKLPAVIETRLMELFDARLNLDDRPMTHDSLLSAIADADALVPTVTDRIDAAVINAAGPRLRLIAGAGLDVFENEPAVSPRLLKLDNVVLLPHMGSATVEGRIEMGERVLFEPY